MQEKILIKSFFIENQQFTKYLLVNLLYLSQQTFYSQAQVHLKLLRVIYETQKTSPLLMRLYIPQQHRSTTVKCCAGKCLWSPSSVGSSAGPQARRIVDETAELVGQVPLVFWQKAAHFYIQEVFGEILHDGSCKTQKSRCQKRCSNFFSFFPPLFPLKFGSYKPQLSYWYGSGCILHNCQKNNFKCVLNIITAHINNNSIMKSYYFIK